MSTPSARDQPGAKPGAASPSSATGVQYNQRMAKSRRKVFISAAASDAPLARELAGRLQAADVDAWNQTLQALPGANISANWDVPSIRLKR